MPQRRRLLPVVGSVLVALLAASPVTAALPATGGWAAVGPAAPPLFATVPNTGAYGSRIGPDGLLYVYGVFTDACGDPTADGLVVIDRATGACHGLGTNGSGDGALNGSVYSIAWLNGVLYAGGSFTSAAGAPGSARFAAWNGTSWTGRGGGFNDSIYSVAVAGGKIYVGGAFSDAGGALGDHILSFDGTAWSPLGSNGAGNGALNAFVQVVYPLPDGRIAAGGGFTDAGGNIAADFAAIWSPTLATWQTVDGSSTPVFNNSVVALAAQGSRIVFGGFFTNAAGDVRADGVAEWTGKAWLHYGTNVAGTDGALGAGYVRSLAIYRGVTIVGGAFHVDGVPAAVNLGAWSGSRWFPLGTPALDEGFLDLQPVGRTLYASGFSSNIAGISSADFIAAFGLPGVASSPRSLVATAGVRRVTLKWAAPATTSGSGPVRDYVVQYRRSGTTAWKTFADGVKATTGATVTGLAPGTTYQFRVLAKTDWGTGAYSAVVAKKAN